MKLYLDYFLMVAKLRALELLYRKKPTADLKRQIEELKRKINNYR